ncbi:hypothetical protein H8E88_21280 [candidate division KSB1 bacterium]|nr:hypothetical protein [candidate division KSB1 bacterium]MBL7093753.1 hypothetical protein [candidate division KSB1 bacterium]
MVKKNIQISLIIGIIFIIFCKNPFATREAEPPSTDQSSWQFPTDPVIVLENMKSAFRERNVENYMKCLVDSNELFKFIPDAYEASTNTGIFERWDLSLEQTYINKIFTSIPDDSTRTLTFDSDFTRNDFPDSVQIRTDYTLVLHHVLSESYPRQGKGKADFWFNRRNGYWVITRWEDYETTVDSTAIRLPSWSTIKASFIN